MQVLCKPDEFWPRARSEVDGDAEQDGENGVYLTGACMAVRARQAMPRPRKSFSRRLPANFKGRVIMIDFKRASIAVVFASIAGVAGSPAWAEMMNLQTTLSAASEVPPNASKATGKATLQYDTASKQLKWNISYSGLSGPATAGHIHGPAAAGANAGVAIPFAKAASPIEGSATLTDAQAADLLAGKYYVNIHSAANPGGEIRGQIAK